MCTLWKLAAMFSNEETAKTELHTRMLYEFLGIVVLTLVEYDEKKKRKHTYGVGVLEYVDDKTKSVSITSLGN